MINAKFFIKFSFKSFNENAFNEIKSVSYKNYFNNKIINVFFTENPKILIILTIKKILYYDESLGEEYAENSECNYCYNCFTIDEKYCYKITLKFHDHNLNYLPYFKELEFASEYLPCTMRESFEHEEEQNLYFNSYLINISTKPFILFFYFKEVFAFEIFEINILDFNNKNGEENILNQKGQGYCYENIENYYIDADNSINDFIQIDDYKLAFMYMCMNNMENSFINKLGIIIIDIKKQIYQYEVYYELFAKLYVINFENYTPMRMKGFNYNGFLLFASSGLINIQDYFFNKDDFNNYLSMFMIFGYANGTDTIINIAEFLFKDNNNNRIRNNFFTFLYKNFTIENNIFEYKPFNLIKLIYVPSEITLYEYNLQTHDKTLLEDYLMISGCIDYTINNDQCDYDYLIEENENLIKISQYYYIDYQYYVAYR